MGDRSGRQTQRAHVVPLDYGRSDNRGTNRQLLQYGANEVPVRVRIRTNDIRRAA